MMNVLVALLAQAAAVPYARTVQARWTGDGSGMEARVVADSRQVSMQGTTALAVILSSDDGPLQISPS